MFSTSCIKEPLKPERFTPQYKKLPPDVIKNIATLSLDEKAYFDRHGEQIVKMLQGQYALPEVITVAVFGSLINTDEAQKVFKSTTIEARQEAKLLGVKTCFSLDVAKLGLRTHPYLSNQQKPFDDWYQDLPNEHTALTAINSNNPSDFAPAVVYRVSREEFARFLIRESKGNYTFASVPFVPLNESYDATPRLEEAYICTVSDNDFLSKPSAKPYIKYADTVFSRIEQDTSELYRRIASERLFCADGSSAQAWYDKRMCLFNHCRKLEKRKTSLSYAYARFFAVHPEKIDNTTGQSIGLMREIS